MSEALRNDFHISEEIGNGRFAAVRPGVAAESGESYAVKTLQKALLKGDSLDGRCLDTETKIMRIVSGNPNIVQIHSVYEDEDSLHILMEFCDGGDLHRRICGGALPEAAAQSVMAPLMVAIAHCHRRGVVHRDIKPENIFFDRRNRLKLGDFGSAEAFGEGEVVSGVVGTPYYVAPEVIQWRDYNEKVDVWSAGVVLYVLLSGQPPFAGATPVEVFESVLRGGLRFPSSRFKSVSSAAKDLIRRMLCKDASRRISAEQVLRHPWIVSGCLEQRSERLSCCSPESFNESIQWSPPPSL